MAMNSSSRVFVAVRVRPKVDGANNPMQANERYHQQACLVLSDTTLRLTDGLPSKESRSFTFTLDRVFGMDTTQEEIYEETAVDAVDSVLAGCNATILTYGQTGSGKTYTMLGGMGAATQVSTAEVVAPDTGIFLRTLQDILGYAHRRRAEMSVKVMISVLEIYLDDVRDLLSIDKNGKAASVPVSVTTDTVRTPTVMVKEIRTLDNAVRVFQDASARRMQRATSANDTSSRSHAMFTIEVFQQPLNQSAAKALTAESLLALRDKAQLLGVEGRGGADVAGASQWFPNARNVALGSRTGPIMYSKLTLVDLAGSEKARNAQVSGAGFEELRRINSSLTSLGNVVHSLYEGSKHVPYRDAKLTIMLRDAFASPASSVALLVNVSPTVLTLDESLSSLYFADKVKAMKTAAGQGGVDPSAAAREAAYLSSLRAFEALKSDVHIASVQHEYQPLYIRTAAQGAKAVHPLLDVSLNITRRLDPTTRANALREVCQALKAAAQGEARRRRQQQEMGEMLHRLRSELIAARATSYLRVEGELFQLATDTPRLIQEFEATVARWTAAISGGHMQLAAASRSTSEARETVGTKSAKLKGVLQAEAEVDQQLAKLSGDSELCELAFLKDEGEVTRWQWGRADEWWDVTDTSLRNIADYLERSSKLLDVRREAVLAEVAYHTTKAQVDPGPVYKWLRHAVWGMAGNAVAQSERQQRLRNPEAAVPKVTTPPVCRFELEQLVLSACQPRQGGSNGPPSVPVDRASHRKSSEHGDVVPVPRNGLAPGQGPADYVRRQRQRASGSSMGRRSHYDDPHLIDDVLSYMELGGTVLKLGRYRAAHSRLLFLSHKPADKASPYHLCWDSSSSLGTGGEGRIPLSSVTKILLGQCTPNFQKRGDPAKYYSSFSLACGALQKPGGRSLEIMCSTAQEMEAWVLGIASITKLNPAFGEPLEMLPGQVSGLTDAEIMLCRGWHIPPAVLCESRQQIERYIAKHSGTSAMRLTPGELSQLSQLDVFRASALWLFFRRGKLLENPAHRLYCYIADTDGETTTVTTMGVTGQRDSADEEEEEGDDTHTPIPTCSTSSRPSVAT